MLSILYRTITERGFKLQTDELKSKLLSTRGIAVASLVITLLLFHFRSYDDNRTTSWRWVFASGDTSFAVLLCLFALGIAYIFSKIEVKERHEGKVLFAFAFISGVLFLPIPEIMIDTARYFTYAKYAELYGLGYFVKEWGYAIKPWTDLPLVPFIYGINIWNLSDEKLSELRNKKIGFMFQFSSLIPTLNAIENVMLPVAFGKGASGDVEKRAKELLELVGLGHRMRNVPSQLSGGEQRRVAIARALINDPDIILADEPTGDLDRETEEEVMELFLKINRDFGKTFVMVTHNPELAKRTDITLRMENGSIIAREEHG